MSANCNALKDEESQVRCGLPPDNHEEHAHFVTGPGWVYWPNPDFVPRPPRQAKGPEHLADLRSRVNGEDRATAGASEGMERVSAVDGAKTWQTEAYALLVDWLVDRAGVEWLPEELWQDLGGPIPSPPAGVDDRALGPVIQRASRNGVIVKTGSMKKATRSHMQDRATWMAAQAS